MEDAQLIERIRRGERDLFGELITRYRAVVFNTILRHAPASEAEEIAQITFIEAYRSLSSYSARAPIKYWLSTIALRCTYDFWRKKRMETPISELSSENKTLVNKFLEDSAQDHFAEENNRKLLLELLQSAMSELSLAERAALKLVYFEGYSTKEAARILNCSVVALKVRALRARKKMRLKIGELIAQGGNK